MLFFFTCKEQLKVRGRLDVVEKKMSLLTGDFIRINKSYLVNTKQIDNFSMRKVNMTDGLEILLSRKYVNDFREKINLIL